MRMSLGKFLRPSALALVLGLVPLAPALAQNVAFMPGEPFFAEPDQHIGSLRLNFSHIDPERLHEGLKRLANVIRHAQAAQAA